MALSCHDLERIASTLGKPGLTKVSFRVLHCCAVADRAAGMADKLNYL